METPTAMIAPLLLRNLITSLFFFADKPLHILAEKYSFLETLRRLLAAFFVFFLRLLPSAFPGAATGKSRSHTVRQNKASDSHPPPDFAGATVKGCGVTGSGGGGIDSGVARGLSHLLSIMTDIPVSSGKYEVVRALAEKLIDENLKEGNEVLREVNCVVLTAAFCRTLTQLDAAAAAEEGGAVVAALPESELYGYYNRVARVLRGLRYYGLAAWRKVKAGDELGRQGNSAEKLAAELLWLAQKMAACGCAEEAVCKWALSSKLAWRALSVEPRLQGSLVKVSAFLIKQARDIGKEGNERSTKEEQRQTKMKILISWIPLLCHATNGTDAPVLGMNERTELERIIEEIIESLELEDEQEKVLSLWLHHFTYSSSSDWPNLRNSYIRWFDASRRVLMSS